MAVWKVWLKCPFCGGYVNRKRSPLTSGKYPLVVRQLIGGRGVAEPPIPVSDDEVVADPALSVFANQILDFIGVMCDRLGYEYPPSYLRQRDKKAQEREEEEEEEFKEQVKAAVKARKEQKAAIKKAAAEEVQARREAKKELREEARREAAAARKLAKQKEAEEKRAVKQKEAEEKKLARQRQREEKKVGAKKRQPKQGVVGGLFDALGEISVPLNLVETDVGNANVGDIIVGESLHPLKRKKNEK